VSSRPAWWRDFASSNFKLCEESDELEVPFLVLALDWILSSHRESIYQIWNSSPSYAWKQEFLIEHIHFQGTSLVLHQMEQMCKELVLSLQIYWDRTFQAQKSIQDFYALSLHSNTTTRTICQFKISMAMLLLNAWLTLKSAWNKIMGQVSL